MWIEYNKFHTRKFYEICRLQKSGLIASPQYVKLFVISLAWCFLLQDAYTDEEGVLNIDEQQDYTLNAAKITHHHVTLKFTRDINTCDENDYDIDVRKN